jgi:hypothetical protein
MSMANTRLSLRTVFTELPCADSVEAIEQLLPIPTSDEGLADVS